MANISQVKINGTTYNLVAATARNQYDNLIDHYLYGDDVEVTAANYSPNNGRFLLNENWGMITGSEGNQLTTYSFIQQNNGNISSDKYDINTDTSTIRGYVPISLAGGTTSCVTTTSSTTNIVTANSGWTIASCSVTHWGQIIELYLGVKYNTKITVSANGNCSDIIVGTLKNTNHWPAIESALRSNGGSAAAGAWGHVNTSGEIVLTAFDGTGSSREVAANTQINLGGSWIAKMENRF